MAFETWPIWLNALVFAAAAAIVWAAGTRVAAYAATIAEATGIGKAFIGAVLLGGITSLPEAGTTIVASAIGNAPLAVNNILGGIALQVTVLAAADVVVGDRALSASIVRPSLLLQGTLLVMLLIVVAFGTLTGDRLVVGVGLWPLVILVATLCAFFLIHRHDPRDTWGPEELLRNGEPAPPAEEAERVGARAVPHETRGLVVKTTIASAVILGAGFLLARTGDALAEQTGLGGNFVGAVLVALATSLPELSTTVGAVRLGEYGMAIANLFGANVLDLGIIFLADVVYPGPPVLNEVGRFSTVAALLGALLTTVYLTGMLERRRRVVLRMGIDSLIVIGLYAAGIIALYALR